MPHVADAKLNDLLDQMEHGKIPVLDFLQGVAGMPEFLSGLGPHVRPSAGGATAAPKGKFVPSRVIMRIKSIDANGDNHVEGAVYPQPAPFTQIMKRGRWHHTATSDGGEVSVAGTRRQLKKGDSVTVPTGAQFLLDNRGQRPWEFSATHSTWHPDTFVYQFGNQTLSGDQLWFAIKTSMADLVQRPFYNIRSSHNGTFSIVMVEPRTGTIPCHYTDGDNIVTMLVGQGDLVHGTGAQMSRVHLVRGTSQTVPSGETFHIVNTGKFPLFAEIRPSAAREWNPMTSFWETSPGNFASGDTVYFEYVFPAP